MNYISSIYHLGLWLQNIINRMSQIINHQIIHKDAATSEFFAFFKTWTNDPTWLGVRYWGCRGICINWFQGCNTCIAAESCTATSRHPPQFFWTLVWLYDLVLFWLGSSRFGGCFDGLTTIWQPPKGRERLVRRSGWQDLETGGLRPSRGSMLEIAVLKWILVDPNGSMETIGNWILQKLGSH